MVNYQNTKIILISIAVSIVLNLLIPFIASKFATKKQIKPPTGANNLNLWDQLMHMFVHHQQVPLTSSIIVAIIVGVSVSLSIIISSNI